MARLHLKFTEDAFDGRILELTQRFFQQRSHIGWKADDYLKGRLFDTWLHGACIVYGLPFPALDMNPKARPPHGMMIDVGWYDAEGVGTIHLKKFSAISLFHQFRHHMQAHTGSNWSHDQHGQDAQEWACSLFYRTDKKLFRKWVRRGRIAGVHESDLLKGKAS